MPKKDTYQSLLQFNALNVNEQDIFNENNLIGLILIQQNRALEKIYSLIPPKIPFNCLFTDNRVKIAKSIQKIYEKEENIDISSIINENPEIDIKYLLDLTCKCQITIDTADKTIKYLHNRYLQKEFLKTLIQIQNEIENLTNIFDIKDKILYSLNLLENISNETIPTTIKIIKDIIKPISEHTQRENVLQDFVEGIPSGFSSYDEYTGGLCLGDLVCIAGRPGMGKTAFMTTMAEHLIMRNIPVCFFSIEMTVNQIVGRMLFSRALVNTMKIRSPQTISKDEAYRIYSASNELKDKPFYIDSLSNHINQIVSSIKLINKKYNVHIFFIDYLQLIQIDRESSSQNRNELLGIITKRLKQTAKETNSCIVFGSQLSRHPELRQDKRPELSDLRDSGEIENDIDIGAFLYRDEKYHPNTEDKGIAEIIIRKQRNGRCGTAKLIFMEDFARFDNL